MVRKSWVCLCVVALFLSFTFQPMVLMKISVSNATEDKETVLDLSQQTEHSSPVSKNTLASTVWSDNFDDGDYSGWTITRGGYSAASNLLRGTTTTWNYIEHPSTTVTGTWSFDYNFYGGEDGIWQSTEGDLGIWFIANDHQSGDTTQAQSGYFILFHPHVGAIELWMDPGDEGYNRVLLDSWSPSNFVKWWHVDITRDSDGVFNVYLDNISRIQATDTSYNTSSFFGFLGYNYQEMDNVEVQDIVVIPTTNATASTTTTTTTAETTTGNTIQPSNMTLIYAGVGIALVLLFAFAAISMSKRKHHKPPTGKQGLLREPQSTLVPTSTMSSDSRDLVLGALKSYPRVSMRELSKLLQLPEDEVRRLTLKLIAAGAVTGAFDRSMDEFVSVSGTKAVRELETDASKAQAFPSCPFCGASLTRPLGAGESMKCENCGKMMKG